MTPQSIITEARDAINDTDSILYRQSNDELVRYVNAGIREFSVLRPEFFATIGDLTCVQGAEQSVTLADAQALVDVLCIHGGAVVPLCDMTVLDAWLPSWRTATPAAAVNWMRKPGDPLRFFVYPPAIAGQTLDVMYVRNPIAVALNDSITEVPQSFQTALSSYVVYAAEMKDDEHVNSGRAVAAYQHFLSIVKPGQQQPAQG